MKPFVLKQHQKDRASVVALRAEEIEAIAGGPTKGNTITVNGGQHGGKGQDDGSDAA